MAQPPNAVTQFLGMLDNFNAEHASELWVPSLNKIVKFKPLMASHQRDMIKTLAGTRYFPSALAITIYEIVRDTCMEPIDLTQLTTIDKLAITLQIRSNNISDNIELQFDDEARSQMTVLNDGKPYDKKLSIKKFLNDVKPKIELPAEVEVRAPGIVAVLRMPTMHAEYRSQQEIYKLSQAAESNDKPVPKEVILAAVFINTIAQYIKTLTIGDVTIDYDKATAIECAYMTERLPRTLINEFGKEIEKFTKLTNVLTETEVTFKKNKFIGTIPIDNSLFEE